MSRCPTTIKAQCYTTLVRPTLEYVSSIWSPSKKDSINKVETVQRQAARFSFHWRLPVHKQCHNHATATPVAGTAKQTSICPDSDDSWYHTQGLQCTGHHSSHKPYASGTNYVEVWWKQIP